MVMTVDFDNDTIEEQCLLPMLIYICVKMDFKSGKDSQSPAGLSTNHAFFAFPNEFCCKFLGLPKKAQHSFPKMWGGGG